MHKNIDLIIADPPYPDYHKDIYSYQKGILDVLLGFKCKQFIFWSAKVGFLLDYTAIHIWDKLMGCASQYERIFERNGGKAYKMYRGCPIQNKVCAQMSRDVYTGHPSQKPIKLILKLVEENSKENDIILDPFMGSGTTAIACKKLGRYYIGYEISKEYCAIAKQRLEAEKTLWDTKD